MASFRPDPDGRIQIYDLYAKTWKRVWFVDAKEMLSKGSASLTGPNIEIFKEGAGRSMVFANELEGKLADGWEILPGQDLPPEWEKHFAETKKLVKPLTDKEVSNSEPKAVDFTKFDLKQLREFGTKAGIAEVQKLTKPQLAEALDKADFKP